MSGEQDIKAVIAPAHKRAEIVFAVVAFAGAVALATQIQTQVTWNANRPFFNQPGFWPVMAIMGMLVFGAAELVLVLRRHARTVGESVSAEVANWARSLEFALWFMAYVIIVPYAGYLPSTLAFTTALTLRLGYRSRRMLLAALATGFVTVVFFKSFLAAKIPGGAVYEYLPAALRNFMILNF
ncbi:MAG: tripartite tricarboxylate transporter TctB family protein [Pseudomonadota bacterium]